ncbi:MAG TPA: YceI family protein [Rickettsiales bacterium]|nr:YceI family protein [Rickettsiales bacterium]
MKKILFVIALIFSAAAAQAADRYDLDPNHTNITWSANHLGFSNPNGKFAKAEGFILLDEKNPQNSKVEVIIMTDSIITGIEKFDEHLKGKDFFAVNNFPAATFTSTEIIAKGNEAKVFGDLTLLGITKPIMLNVVLNKIGRNQFSKKITAGFSATAIIKRSQFKMDYAIPLVSDDVKLEIEVEGILVK